MTQDLTGWIGRSFETPDVISPERAHALSACLETGEPEPEPGTPLPPLWHWLYFWETIPRSRLGPDGRTALGDFLPPLGEVRRMWAGSRVTFYRPLRIGAEGNRRTTITHIASKEGRSGALTFITLTHEIATGDGLAITDEQNLVFREKQGPAIPARPPEAAPEGGDRVEPWTADPVMLFQYSALTFNSHRIHYDAPYTTGEEGYPGIIVHGPLIATLMAGAACRHRGLAALSRFEFRAVSPLFAGDPFTVHVADRGSGADVWVRGEGGALVARGSAAWPA